MAYSLNGNNAKIDFSIGNLIGVDGGPISVASLVKLGDASNGALAHIVNSSGAAGVLFVETFGTLNFGVNTIAKTVSSANLSTLGIVGNWAVLGASKVDVTGAPAGHYGVLGGALTHFTAGSSLTDVSAGNAADATFKIRIGQFLNSGSEFINGEFAVDAIWKRVLSNAEWDSLSTGDYTTWQALAPDWMVQYTAITSRVDATGGGGDELSRTGSPAISLTADPVGFFGGSAITSSDTGTLDDSSYKLSTRDIESITLSEGTPALSTSITDASTLVEGIPSIATSSTDTSTLTESERISVTSTDTFTLVEGTAIMTVGISEVFTLVEGTPSLAMTSTDAFTFSDTAAGAAVKEADSFTLTDTVTPRLGVTDSDSSLLTETQRGSVSSTDSFMLDDTGAIRISLGVVDQFTLASELERIGVLSTDAFILSDAVFSGKGIVTGQDTFALIEHEHVDGIPEESGPVTPITISIESPSLTLKLGTPRLVVSLFTPKMGIRLQ